MNVITSNPAPVLNLRPEAEQAPTSGIVDVFNYGRTAGHDPALGGRGRSADAVLHLRGGSPVPGGRRDLLHLSARHS